MDKESKVEGARRSMLSALPLYTLSGDLLDHILQRNCVSEADAAVIREYHALLQKQIGTILSHSPVCDDIPVLTADAFAERPMALSISCVFYARDILYTYDEYAEHLEQTRRFADQNEGYSVIENGNPPFGHIQICILEKRWVMVSKDKAPTIHFVIRHPKLRNAIENMIVPYTE